MIHKIDLTQPARNELAEWIAPNFYLMGTEDTEGKFKRPNETDIAPSAGGPS